VDFNERIRVNGQPIPHQYVIDFVEQERPFFEPLQPSFFELTTAMAFKYFAEQHVDIAVIEVGLGGRLDCTNIITPLLSVITNISFDHTGFLGDTLAKIAGEKAGIIKPGVPVVVGETTPETRPVFEGKAAELQAPIFFAEERPLVTPEYLADFALKGGCQTKNLNTILNAIRVLSDHCGIVESPKTVSAALRSVVSLTGLRGRWEVIQQQPLVICDTGHNLAAWEYLAEGIKTTAKRCGGRLHIVFGMVDDKDVNAVLDLLPKDATYYFTQADTHRAIPSEKLLSLAQSRILHGESYPDVKSAYAAAIGNANASDFVYVGGSSYVVADFLGC
jgi:dihydrofolate synthase/folylpolyglutamate synthase